MRSASNEAPKAGAPALYRKLRPRPNGPSPEEVESNQRSRLHGATIEALASRGYAATSVAELCRLAGVSKRTFYEQFHNKEACFLSTYDRAVASANERAAAARHGQAGWEAGVRSLLAGLAQAVLDAPKAARLALVEAPAAGPVTLIHRDGARAQIERMLVESFSEAEHGVAMPPAVAAGIVCGAERAVRACLRDERTEEIGRVSDELAEWAIPFGSPALADLLPRAPAAAESSPLAPRPRARHGTGHARIMRAAAEIVAEDGYERLTAAKIARRAGIAEVEFWDSYRSTEECFLDALDRVCLEALLGSVRAARAAEDPLVGMCRGVSALLDCVALDPVLRSVAFVEVYEAGSEAVRCSERFVDRLLDLLAEPLPPSRQAPAVAHEASAGALWGLVSHRALHDGEEGVDPRTFAAHASYLALVPLVGPEAAVRAIRADADTPAADARETGRAGAQLV